MVLEHCSGGDLVSTFIKNILEIYFIYHGLFITQLESSLIPSLCCGNFLKYCRIPYSEKDSAKIIGKLLSAISYMHKHGITHRDLKFENILFESPHPDAEIKLIDFGLSKKVEGEKKHMTEGVGTIYTMAPQVLRGVYTSKADLWSIGYVYIHVLSCISYLVVSNRLTFSTSQYYSVITYMLLSNTKPFNGRKRSQVMRMILKGKYSFDSRRWNHISNEAMDFVSQLLIVKEDERIDADEALNHEWQSKQFNVSERTPDITLMNTVQDTIVNYGAMGEFKKMALMVIAHKSTTDEILSLRQAFDAFDTSNNGTISMGEFKDAMKKVKNQISDEEIENIFNSIDVGADGEIHYLEFLAATLQAHGRITEERLAEAFDRIDSDDSGVISKQNLRELLGTDYSDKKIDEMLKEVDMNNDGGITFDEFREIFRAEQVKEEKRLMPISSHDLGSSFGE